MTSRRVDVRVDRDGPYGAKLARHRVRVDVRDERGLDRRGDRGRRLQPERQLASVGGRWPPAPGRRRQIPVGGREAGEKTPELEVAEELEHARAVVAGTARLLEVEPHRQVGHDPRELAAVEHLRLVRLERVAPAPREARETRGDPLERG